MAFSRASSASIVPLELEGDYYPWFLSLRNLFRGEGLWGMVKGSRKKPLELKEVVTPTEATDGATVLIYALKEGYTERDLERWSQRDREAKAIIYLYVGPDLLASVLLSAGDIRSTTSHQLWNEISRQCGNVSRYDIVLKWREFIALEYCEETNLEDFLREWMEKVAELRWMGRVMTEEDLLLYFRIALGSHYRFTIELFYCLPEVEQTFSTLQHRIIQDEKFSTLSRAFKRTGFENHASSGGRGGRNQR